jgi:hypothetical protein
MAVHDVPYHYLVHCMRQVDEAVQDEVQEEVEHSEQQNAQSLPTELNTEDPRPAFVDDAAPNLAVADAGAMEFANLADIQPLDWDNYGVGMSWNSDND